MHLCQFFQGPLSIEKGTLPWSLNRDTFDSIDASAHAFSAFLGQLIFCMGMFKVFRWNGLEILILKHM